MASYRVTVDVPELFRLWHSKMSRRDVCLRLGLTNNQLRVLEKRHGLHARGPRERPTGKPKVDVFTMPAEEYERRKAEVKAMSLAKKRAERYEPKDI